MCLGNKVLDYSPSWQNSQLNDDKLEKLGIIFKNFDKLGWSKWLWRRAKGLILEQTIEKARRLRW